MKSIEQQLTEARVRENALRDEVSDLRRKLAGKTLKNNGSSVSVESTKKLQLCEAFKLIGLSEVESRISAGLDFQVELSEAAQNGTKVEDFLKAIEGSGVGR